MAGAPGRAPRPRPGGGGAGRGRAAWAEVRRPWYPSGAGRARGARGVGLDRPRGGGGPAPGHRVPGGGPMTAPFRELDSVVLTCDVPEAGLRAGDLGAVVQVYGADAV